jgi:hypothetical protein
MKKSLTVTTTLLLAVMLSVPAQSQENTDPTSPCTVTLCMWGELTGKHQQACRAAIKKFFSLNVFKKHHHFSPGDTVNRRKQFLSQCHRAAPDAVGKIVSRFGRKRG